MNATNTHTPGPWRVYRIGERVAVETCENPALIVAAATLTGDPKEQEANARLIAAAPALLAALDVLLNSVDAVEIPAQGDGSKMAALYYAMEDARAALRLARGS